MKKIILIMLLGFASLFAFEELNSENFDAKIKDKNVIIDFYAVWCHPCKILNKNLQAYDIKKPESITIYKINIDEEMEIAKKYGVNRLPSLVYFKDGEAVKTIVGIQSSNELLKSAKKIFNSKQEL